jgi:hypothetical protein
MSLDTVFDVWPNCLLALPTLLATDFTSRSGSFALPIERGRVTPRTFVRRVRRLSTRPPTSPAAAAPTATAGPPALLAAPFSVPTIPLSFWLVLLRLELAPLRALDLLRVCGLRFAVEREPLLRARVEADDFERDEPPEARDAPLVFEPAPFDALLLLCLLGEADLLVAIRDTSPIENIRFSCAGRVPVWECNNPSVQGIAERI